ncbi:hypothetical protein [Heyndrickxia acidicola]|uniref:Cardiolipin synthase N-terminal domain-containing protein n=1 Tax=Heyndrickxia acidicola TaxID=209389 RepID=A0ABU6MMB1_9BACI|nr:hypothetical protein [Heyndrickxia acidicola]MED1205826.1 hypothetical protein [Heyndrickxia acidicola]
MGILSSIFPIIALFVDLVIMIGCLKRISAQIYFNFLNRTIWVFIVVFGSIFGQLMYFLLELKSNDR